MNGEIVEIIEESDDREISIHPHIDPKLSLPEHLQSIDFDDDIWRRASSAKLKNSYLNVKYLKENSETRDLVRSLIAAASEREKDVLMHNQARYFSGILYSVMLATGDFLNKPLTPKSWSSKNNSKENGNSSTSSEKIGVKGFISFLLTPKVFLTIIAIGFGVLAGYSRIQIFNLNETITTYQSTLASMKESKSALEQRINDFDSILEKKDLKLEKQIDELATHEKENVQLTAEAAGLVSSTEKLELRIKNLGIELKKEREGKSSTEVELRTKLDSENQKLLRITSEKAVLASENKQIKEIMVLLENAKSDIKKEKRILSSQIIDFKKELAKADIELSKVRKDQNLLTFAERSLNNIRHLTEKYSVIKDEHVLYHIKKYDSRKLRHNQK